MALLSAAAVFVHASDGLIESHLAFFVLIVALTLYEDWLRVAADRERREYETRLILDTAHDGFISSDDRGRMVDWNPRAESIFGWAGEEILGRDLAEQAEGAATSSKPSCAISPSGGETRDTWPPSTR